MYEILVGLNVIDEKMYQKYREEIIPILQAHGGGFHYDFKVSDVLISQTKDEINRVFTIYFTDANKKEEFFSNLDYLKIKELYFDGAVKATTIISSHSN